MNILSKEELIKTEGGAALVWTKLLGVIGGALTFGIGFINGLLRPLGCSK